MSADLTVLIDALTGEVRTAVLKNGEAIALSVLPPSSSPHVGDVYAGRVRSVGEGGAFVDLGNGIDGFLPAKALTANSLRSGAISEGGLVAVAVRREGVRGKGCRLALAESAEALPETPGRIRTGGGPLADIDERRIARIVAEGEVRIPSNAERVERHTGATPLFSAYDVEGEFERVLEPTVALPEGGRLIVEETAALVAIDVDGGPSKPAQANRRAVPAIVRTIALRGLAGVIMIDPAGSNDRSLGFRMADALMAQFDADDVVAEVKGVTRAGLVEIVRPKRRESVAETMRRLRSRAYAAIRAAHGEVPHLPGQSVAIRANVDLTELLGRDVFAPEFSAFEARHGVALRLETDDAMARGQYEVVGRPL